MVNRRGKLEAKFTSIKTLKTIKTHENSWIIINQIIMDITYPQLICHLLNLSLPVNKSDLPRPHQDRPDWSMDAWLSYSGGFNGHYRFWWWSRWWFGRLHNCNDWDFYGLTEILNYRFDQSIYRYLPVFHNEFIIFYSINRMFTANGRNC